MAWLMAPLVAFLVTAPIRHVDGAGQQKVRRAAVAGSFYPADPKELSAMIDDMLAHATPAPVDGPILAAVAPHAGYPYSGPVAAWTYAALKGHKYSRVVVIAPSHYVAFDFTSVYDGDAYETPLGTIPDRQGVRPPTHKDEFHHPLLRTGPHAHIRRRRARYRSRVALAAKGAGQLRTRPHRHGRPELREQPRARRCARKADRSEKKPGDTLILASSDLSHYHPYDEAETIDHKTLHALASWDYFSMSRNFESRTWEACGGAPIVAAMISAERMGANKAEVLRYANSGDTSGDHSRVVGYSADLFVKTPGSAGRRNRPSRSPIRRRANCSPWPASPLNTRCRRTRPTIRPQARVKL